MRSVFAGIAVWLALAASAAASDLSEWNGTWQATRGHGNGKLHCYLRPLIGGNKWEATFSGKHFRGYRIVMEAEKKGAKVHFEGKANLKDGWGIYHWTGKLSGNQFSGTYKSTAGREGVFQLRQKK